MLGASMVRRIVMLLVAALFLSGLVALADPSPALADPPPAQSQQPRPDMFASGVAAHPTLDYYRPIQQKIDQTGAVRWAYKVESGCSDQSTVGYHSIGYNIGTALGDAYNKTNVASVYVTDGSQDFTVHIVCGASATATGVTGGVIGCLCSGYGGNSATANDVQLHQDMRDFPDLSQVSIVTHEVVGHDYSTFNEQYCNGYNDPVYGCTGLFAESPGWLDVMNTGPSSRHLIGDIELSRWGRVHGTPAPQSYGVDPRGFLWFCGVSSKAVGIWIDGVGSVNLGQLSQSNGCYGVNLVGYLKPGSTVTFDLGNYVDWKSPLFRSDRSVQYPS